MSKNQSDEVQEQAPLFADHKKVYPKSVRGPYRRIKWIALSIILSLYYLMPLLRWSRGDGMANQAVLFDFSGRRFYFFDIEIWPQQIYYFTFILIFSALGLFLTTSLFGRLWCGYACPQTLWTDLFMLVERWIEGDRGERIRRDQGPRTIEKLRLKLAKHAAWLAISLLTGGWFILYFYDAPTLAHDIVTLQVSSQTVVLIGILTAITYFLAGFLREHTCTFMCPWPRFQAAMQDEESLIVTYRRWRGERRAPFRRAVGWSERKAQGLGDCIDCGVCQQVCPTGIDIRDGSQLQCIGCALCIDACDEVMGKMGRPRGLIAFDTVNAQVACAAGQTPRYRLLRPRTLVYMALMVIIGSAVTISYEEQPKLHVSVLRDRAPLYVRLAGGQILNGYTLKALNMTRERQDYELSLSGISGATMVQAGGGEAPVAALPLMAAPDTVATYRILVRAPQEALTGVSTPLHFKLSPRSGGDAEIYDTVFMGPQ